MTIKNTHSNASEVSKVLGELAEVATPLSPNRPSAEWSLDQLGLFARQTLRQSAESSWGLGRTLVLAKEKANRKFGAWTKEYLPELSARTIQRYMAVGRLDYDDVRGKSIGEIYALLWGESHKNKKKIEPLKKVSTNIKSLMHFLEGESSKEVLTANRDSLVVLHKLLSKILMD
jgi:hypothetical protein